MKEHYHSVPLDEVYSLLVSGEEGLSDAEAERRLKKDGPNSLPTEKQLSRIALLLSQFNNPLIYLLIGAMGVSIFLKHYNEAIFILVVLAIHVAVSYYQENKVDRSLRALKQMVTMRVRVMRGGTKKEIGSKELVVGDVMYFQPGDKVSADCRLIDSSELQVNEASLTGESRGVGKTSGVLPETSAVSDRTNMLFMGTLVEDGWGRAVVVSTGARTEFGKIVSMLAEIKEPRTPLQNKVASLSKWIAFLLVAIIGALILYGIHEGKTFAEVFITSLALAVSAIPDGLLPAITIILALGSRRILDRGGLVRKLNANETLGSTTVICTDKTGTLTEGKMRVSQVLTCTEEISDERVSGAVSRSAETDSHVLALKIAILTNDAYIENAESQPSEWILRGRPVEKALLSAGIKAGLKKRALEENLPLIEHFHFSPKYKYSATLHSSSGGAELYVIGAPEEVIARAKKLDVNGKPESLSGEEAKLLLQKFEGLIKKGLYVLACAKKTYTKVPTYGVLTELVEDLELVGFIALSDPLRPSIARAIATARHAGIKTIIITGDHKLTAQAAATEIGLPAGEESIIEGKDLELMSEEELRKRIGGVSIFARVLPSHKSRIVAALQHNGEIVAMVGDGVNDAPALKAADIGVAVGSGTDVAKEVADLVLLDDSFETVVKAVEEGRMIFNNIRKVAIYLLSVDFAELFLFFTALFLRWPLPFLPTQILWINIVETGFPDIALAFEKDPEGVMDEKPRNKKTPIIDGRTKLWMTAVFIVNGLAALFLFGASWILHGDIDKARTLVFVLMAMDSLFLVMCVRSLKRTVFRRDIFSNHILFVGVSVSFLLMVAAVHVPFLQRLLDTVPLTLSQWAFILGIGICELIIIDIIKTRIFRVKKVSA